MAASPAREPGSDCSLPGRAYGEANRSSETKGIGTVEHSQQQLVTAAEEKEDVQSMANVQPRSGPRIHRLAPNEVTGLNC